MARVSVLLALFLLIVPRPTLAGRDGVVESVNRRSDATWTVARRIWELAEPGYQETESAALLAKTLEQSGFRLQTEIAGIPTAFSATFGNGQPVIGILGEFDALPGLSQDAVSARQPREGLSYGHGCLLHI